MKTKALPLLLLSFIYLFLFWSASLHHQIGFFSITFYLLALFELYCAFHLSRKLSSKNLKLNDLALFLFGIIVPVALWIATNYFLIKPRNYDLGAGGYAIGNCGILPCMYSNAYIIDYIHVYLILSALIPIIGIISFVIKNYFSRISHIIYGILWGLAGFICISVYLPFSIKEPQTLTYYILISVFFSYCIKVPLKNFRVGNFSNEWSITACTLFGIMYFMGMIFLGLSLRIIPFNISIL